MIAMFGHVPGVDQDIVYGHDDKPVEELPEHLVHKKKPWKTDGEMERLYSMT